MRFTFGRASVLRVLFLMSTANESHARSRWRSVFPVLATCGVGGCLLEFSSFASGFSSPKILPVHLYVRVLAAISWSTKHMLPLHETLRNRGAVARTLKRHHVGSHMELQHTRRSLATNKFG